MHELSMCRAIADTASAHADGRPIERIRLRIGYFRQVVPDTLAYCWELHSQGTALEGCVLDVDHIPAVASCSTCNHATTLTQPVLRCEACAGTEVDLVSGDEFLIESIDVVQETR